MHLIKYIVLIIFISFHLNYKVFTYSVIFTFYDSNCWHEVYKIIAFHPIKEYEILNVHQMREDSIFNLPEMSRRKIVNVKRRFKNILIVIVCSSSVIAIRFSPNNAD